MKVIKVKSCRTCPHLVTYKPYGEWENEKKHHNYCGRFDISGQKKIKYIDIVDKRCPLEELKS